MAASLNQLTADVAAWLDRGDLASLIPGWVLMVETDIATQLRARVMVKRATTLLDGIFIELPSDWLHWESIKDDTTGRNLRLEDDFTGPPGYSPYNGAPATAFRMTGNCIEFLPHPPAPQSGVTPQSVNVSYYARPRPLAAGTDTNPVLDAHYAIYLFGVCRYGAMFELDDARATQAAQAFAEQVMAANAWKASSDYSGGPVRAVVNSF